MCAGLTIYPSSDHLKNAFWFSLQFSCECAVGLFYLMSENNRKKICARKQIRSKMPQGVDYFPTDPECLEELRSLNKLF